MPPETVRFYEDVADGELLPELAKGPLTPIHLMRWSAAIENWHRIHYDHRYATGHDGVPDILVNGSLKQQFLAQLLKDWAGPAGWMWKLSYEFRGMNLVGERLRAWGRVRRRECRAGLGLIHVEVGLRNDAGTESTPGSGIVVLPLRGGRPVPYPFPPDILDGSDAAP